MTSKLSSQPGPKGPPFPATAVCLTKTRYSLEMDVVFSIDPSQASSRYSCCFRPSSKPSSKSQPTFVRAFHSVYLIMCVVCLPLHICCDWCRHCALCMQVGAHTDACVRECVSACVRRACVFVRVWSAFELAPHMPLSSSITRTASSRPFSAAQMRGVSLNEC